MAVPDRVSLFSSLWLTKRTSFTSDKNTPIFTASVKCTDIMMLSSQRISIRKPLFVYCSTFVFFQAPVSQCAYVLESLRVKVKPRRQVLFALQLATPTAP